MVVWPVMFKWLYIVEGVLRCSLNLSPNVVKDSPIYSSLQSTLSHLYLQMTPLFLVMGSLSLGATRWLLMVLSPLKYTCTPCLLHIFLRFSPSPLVYGATIWDLWLLDVILAEVLVPLLFLTLLAWALIFSFILLRAHKWYLHFAGLCADVFLLQELKAGTNSSGPVM